MNLPGCKIKAEDQHQRVIEISDVKERPVAVVFSSEMKAAIHLSASRKTCNQQQRLHRYLRLSLLQFRLQTHGPYAHKI